MDFINKLIKKGSFYFILCFSLFVLFGANSALAASNCNIKINDGDEYLVLNTKSGWGDSGVSVYCTSTGGVTTKQENVFVSINGGDAIETIDSGRDISNQYLTKAGFYKIKYEYYYYNETSGETEPYSITRQVRVLPEDLNGVRNVWLGEFNENTAGDDTFVKIIDHRDNYVAIGNFGLNSYVTYFDSLGRYLWHYSFENTMLKDIAKSGDLNGNTFFVVGQNPSKKGFIKAIQLNVDGDGIGTGVNESYVVEKEFSSGSVISENVTMINKLISTSNYVYATGYLLNEDGSKTGKIIKLRNSSGSSLDDIVYYSNVLDSEYNSLVATQVGSELKVVAVGATEVESYGGALDGLITICSEDLTVCETTGAGLWKNSNGASTTTTTFNDIVRQGDNYLIVGKSRIDKVAGTMTTNNSGGEDSLIVLLNSSFSIIDISLIGSSSADVLYSIKEISNRVNVGVGTTTYKYIVAGKKAAQGIYLFVDVTGNDTLGYSLMIEENVISGRNGNVEIRDVFVRKEVDEDINFIFVGSTQATVVENIIFSENGISLNDALLAIVDNTKFSNYEDINIKEGTLICDMPDGEGKTDGIADSSSCSSMYLMSKYKLMYGTSLKDLYSVKDIDTTVLGTISAYHSFENGQGVKFILGRDVIVSANLVAPDISIGEMGIDKWYLYSRAQNVGENVASKERAELWTDRYIPVKDNQNKEANTTYYILNNNEFIIDSSSRIHTYNNYVKIADYIAVKDGEDKEEGIKYYVLDEKYDIDTGGSNKTLGNYLKNENYKLLSNGEDKEEGITYYIFDGSSYVVDESVSPTTNNNYIKEISYVKVEDGLTKQDGTTYYVLSSSKYVLDTSSSEKTYKNYVAVEEPLNSSVAFQSVEKAQEFALLQELARVAFVKKKYNYDATGISAFQGETANLVTQNYYFIYYIDLSITDVLGCGTTNGILYGTCNEYTGYAFASLSRLKDIASLIVQKYNYFVSESNNRFNPSGNISLPETNSFKEEMSTTIHMKNTSVNLGENMYLEVTHYPIVKTVYKYEFNKTGNVTNITGKSTVVFSSENTADYKQEGKYVIRYCYNYGQANQSCGSAATFVIDRTAPIVNYTLSTSNKGTINSSSLITSPTKIKTGMTIDNIVDIDPYAYTLISGKKYYLQCNPLINSSSCISNVADYVNKAYAYQKDNPNNIYNIVVYDRAGNFINSYFKVGTSMPEISIEDNDQENSFVLSVDFYGRNDISGLSIAYTKSEACSGGCADSEVIKNAIMLLVEYHIYNNQLELDKKKENPDYEANVVDSIDFNFVLSLYDGNVMREGTGISIPEVNTEVVNGKTIYTLTGNNNVYAVSKGLYSFVLTDNFYNVSEDYGGIGIAKAELDIYVNEGVDIEKENIESSIPTPKEEIGDRIPVGEFVAVTPSTYAYISSLPEDLIGFDREMFFTNKYVYIKFKKNEFGLVTISRATSLNNVGNYDYAVDSNNPEMENLPTKHLECLFKIYGNSLNAVNIDECNASNNKGLIKFANVPSYVDELKNEGIYFISSDKTGEYAYFVFTDPGTYFVVSSVHVAVTDAEGEQHEIPSMPADYSFTIDNEAPIVDLSVVCPKTPCVGENDNFDGLSFEGNTYRVNIGNHNMQVAINVDLLLGGAVNRLLAVSVNGSDVINAYSYSKQTSKSQDGNYIVFVDTGVYVVDFYDAAQNKSSYTFIIDKTPPVISSIRDIHDKKFSEYQQYVEVEIVVDEGSFLENNIDEDMLVLLYWLDGESAKEIRVRNINKNCVIFTGTYDSGYCTIEEKNGVKGLKLNVVIPINKDIATRDSSKVIQTLNISVQDYFANMGDVFTQSFSFDNIRPYMYFSSEYNPILEFGNSVSNEKRENMLTLDADSTLGSFNCDSGIHFDVGHDDIVNKLIILCGDKPDSDISNRVSVNAYEAYRVAYNNYKKNGEVYEYVTNGTYLPHNNQTVVYKANYSRFASSDALLSFIDGGGKIYTKGAFVKVTSKDYIDPNVVYFDSTGNNGVSLQDLYVIKDDKSIINTKYTNNQNGCSTNPNSRLCQLYLMYTTDATFADNQDFYTRDSEVYEVVDNPTSIKSTIQTNANAYLDYFYLTKYTVDEGKYLPSITTANTCVKVGDSPCRMLTASEIGKVKLNEVKYLDPDTNTETTKNVIYYTIINISNSDLDAKGETILTSNIRRITMEDNSVVTAIVDNTIWQIDSGAGSNKAFQFGLASNLGRPIIFVAKDGAGNVAYSHLETVIAIRDDNAPEINQVYVIDDSTGNTLNNYVKDGNSFVSVIDGLEKAPGVTYYKSLGTNYLSSKDLIVEFNEPIYKVQCAYYVYNGNTDSWTEKECSFNGEEYDYSDDKKLFELTYVPSDGESNYFVNYIITVYDFSSNVKVINSLFIDREKPTIKLNDKVSNKDEIETVYTADGGKSKYNENYVLSGFMSETTAIDSIDTRVANIGASNIENTFSYEVKYYKFNYNITYKNYTFSGNVPVSVTDGIAKDPSLTYYVLIKRPTDYVLKGNSGTCKMIDDEEYCYVVDDTNYYPTLINNPNYWIELSDDAYYIQNNKVGVYKIEYKVVDYSGNVSDTLIKTVYCHDKTIPVLKDIKENQTLDIKSLYGYHQNIKIGFENEQEAMFYSYKCKDGSTTCVLPSVIFSPKGSNLELDLYEIDASASKQYYYDGEAIYKVYLHDKGYYRSTINGDGIEMMALKYNMVEYTFLIDITVPELYVNAFEDANGDLYYEANLVDEEYLYCVRGDRNVEGLAFGNQLVECKNSSALNANREVTDSSDENKIIRKMYDSNDRLVYEEQYIKLTALDQKYFYKTYYYMDNGNLRQYALGASYDDNNVYSISSIKLFFYNDGSYLIMSKDKSDNSAGRKTGSCSTCYEKTSSSFLIDNTAPTYNAGQNSPTGINYWFSVPSKVITNDNVHYLKTIHKDDFSNSYDISTSGLNSSFFYAFATKAEANEYLTSIYTDHINSLNDNSCVESGKSGFYYGYYNVATNEMVYKCFVGQSGDNKRQAKNEVITNLINKVIYPTFSGATLFGDSAIKQVACNESVSSNCKNSKDMYKVIYLKVEKKTIKATSQQTITKSIVEACEESVTENEAKTEITKVECIKVNAKIIKNDGTNNFNFEIGGTNAVDTSSITIYDRSIVIGSATNISNPYTVSPVENIKLKSGQYYIFEEIDKTITYVNYIAGEGVKPDLNHYNTSYYAIYVDNNDPINVYYHTGSEVSGVPLSVEGVETNVDEYYLIIKNDNDDYFENKYEIHSSLDKSGRLEVYSYLILVINGECYNINDYIVKDEHEYYFKIPMLQESITKVEIYDRAGNKVFKVDVSMSQRAPGIEISYSGQGGEQTITLVIEDTSLTKTNIDTIKILFSTNRENYANEKTGNIRDSLLCSPGSTGKLYGCTNVGAVNGINSYRIVISNKEQLYGFFKVSLADYHGNTNSVEFMYNPADMSANYTANMKFIDNSMDDENPRMVTNEKVELEFNNQINYIILYKLDDSTGEFIAVCNSKNIVDGQCPGENSSNRIYREVDQGGKYVKSILYYDDEGIYRAEIINRASEVINNACYDGNTLDENCKNIKTSTSLICSWEENPEYCDDALQIMNKNISHSYSNREYNKIEIDRTMPQVETSGFTVFLPTGSQAFVNGGEYTNAEIEITWEEELIQLVYTCNYINSVEPCNGNSTGFMLASKTYTFVISNSLSAEYEFWFEDYAGNTTINDKYSFTVVIELPEFTVYEVDDNNIILGNKPVVEGSTIKNNVQLLCYVDSEIDSRCATYDVKLERFNGTGYVQEMLTDVTKISVNYGSFTTYKYTLSIKDINGEPYDYLKSEFIFTIDKQAPIISVEGSFDDLWGIYKGEVRIMVSDDGLGTIYSGCISTGVDVYGDKIYECNQEPYDSFTSNYTLTKTGVYKIIAEDSIGNVTKGKEIKYINIDNEAPTVDIEVKGQYLNYNIAEYGFTNAQAIIVNVKDNNDGSRFIYRVKNAASNDSYGPEFTTVSNYLEITEEGYYEITPVDAVGNKGMSRHFIIYRQAPIYTINAENTEDNLNKDIVNKKFNITWSTNVYSYVAPIIKVTMNGKPYSSGTVIENTGEYTFVFTDLAGNTATRKVVVNKSKSICLGNVTITPKKQSILYASDLLITSDKYTFTDDDVIIFATPAYYFGGASSCGDDLLNYNYLDNDKKSYLLMDGYADYANANKKIKVNLGDDTINLINELGGSIYVIVVSKDVAKNDLGLPIGENFFLKDPLGWSLIFAAGLGVLYIGVRLVFFRKKVKVLK